MYAENQTYTQKTIHLDGTSFYKCRFDKSKIVFTGLISSEADTCVFDECTWIFEGPARNTLGFLSNLYAMGADGAKFVETTFDDIRARKFIARSGP